MLPHDFIVIDAEDAASQRARQRLRTFLNVPARLLQLRRFCVRVSDGILDLQVIFGLIASRFNASTAEDSSG